MENKARSVILLPYPSVKHLNPNVKKALKTRKERHVFLKAFNAHAEEHGDEDDYKEGESFMAGYRAARAHRESLQKLSDIYRFEVIRPGMENYHDYSPDMPSIGIHQKKAEAKKAVALQNKTLAELEQMHFPADRKRQVREGIKNSTMRVSDEQGKYKEGQTYNAASYAGKDWDAKVHVTSLKRVPVHQLNQHGIPQFSIDAMVKAQKLKPESEVELIRFKRVLAERSQYNTRGPVSKAGYGYITPKGYRRVWDKETKRHVMEHRINKDVPEGFHVHHKDKDTGNNNEDNLVVVNGLDHNKYHSSLSEVYSFSNPNVVRVPVEHAHKYLKFLRSKGVKAEVVGGMSTGHKKVSDIDIIIRPKNVTKAISVLRKHGHSNPPPAPIEIYAPTRDSQYSKLKNTLRKTKAQVIKGNMFKGLQYEKIRHGSFSNRYGSLDGDGPRKKVFVAHHRSPVTTLEELISLGEYILTYGFDGEFFMGKMKYNIPKPPKQKPSSSSTPLAPAPAPTGSPAPSPAPAPAPTGSPAPSPAPAPTGSPAPSPAPAPTQPSGKSFWDRAKSDYSKVKPWAQQKVADVKAGGTDLFNKTVPDKYKGTVKNVATAGLVGGALYGGYRAYKGYNDYKANKAANEKKKADDGLRAKYDSITRENNRKHMMQVVGSQDNPGDKLSENYYRFASRMRPNRDPLELKPSDAITARGKNPLFANRNERIRKQLKLMDIDSNTIRRHVNKMEEMQNAYR